MEATYMGAGTEVDKVGRKRGGGAYIWTYCRVLVVHDVTPQQF